MRRGFVLLVVAALAGCDFVPTNRFEVMMSLHERRLIDAEKKVQVLSAELEMLRAQVAKESYCVDVMLTPGGLSPIGNTGLMVSVKSMRRPDGTFDAAVVNGLGVDIDSATIRVVDAEVRMRKTSSGKALKMTLFAPEGATAVPLCAEDIVFSYFYQP